MPTRTKQKPIHLDFRSQETVVVVSDDEDRFVTTSSQAALACKQVEDNKEWNRQWTEFLNFLHHWCKDRSEQVKTGYVSIGDSGLNTLICLHMGQYDFSMEDDLVKLDVLLSKRFPLCVTDVLQIPNQRTLTSELFSETLIVYGNGE